VIALVFNSGDDKVMNNWKKLAIALSITLLVFLIELGGGFISNSLALLSDAGHMLTDVMALALALIAMFFATRPATREKTFGFYRLEIFSALLNGSFLVLIAFYIFYQAYQRFAHPAPVETGIMLLVASIGLLANVVAALVLAGSSQGNLNVRGAFLHVLSDLGASVGVIGGGVIIHFTRWYFVDPILGILIGVLILRGALLLLIESANILLEGAPSEAATAGVEAEIRAVKGVLRVHDLHVWVITSGLNACSAHVLIDDAEVPRTAEILREINQRLKEKFQIGHSTFQTECESCPEGIICYVEPTVKKEHGHQH
jgi:cobalt-zinc-cadmium efflux system protein